MSMLNVSWDNTKMSLDKHKQNWESIIVLVSRKKYEEIKLLTAILINLNTLGHIYYIKVIAGNDYIYLNFFFDSTIGKSNHCENI